MRSLEKLPRWDTFNKALTRSYVEILLANTKHIQILSFCVGNFYFWQALAAIGFYRYLRRLADKFPALPIVATDSLAHVGPTTEELLAEKETALNAAVSKNDNLDRENAGLRAKVARLQTEVDFITKDRYALVREKLTLENKLGDFNSWPEFRIEYDQLTTEFVAMKRQRAREHILQQRTLQIAKERKVELAAAKQAEAMSKVAHSKELERAQQERDGIKEKYQILLATTSAAAANAAVNTAPAATATATAPTEATIETPGDFDLQEESNRLTLTLRSQTPLIAKLSSDVDRLQSLLKTRANQSALLLKTAASTITSLEEKKAKAEERIAGLERDAKEANAKAEEMEELYMAVAFGDESGGEQEEEEQNGEDEQWESGGEKAERSWPLKVRKETGGSGLSEDGKKRRRR